MKTDFNFSSAETLEVLKHWKNIRYIGNAMSDFQAQPFFFTPERGANMSSDWEFELLKRMSGSSSGIIKGAEATRNMPNFHSHMEEYVTRSKELGENAFRFSLDFGRLCPEEGEFDEFLMARYVKMMALVRAAGQEPMVTMYHWPIPKDLVRYNKGKILAGGWEHPDIIKRFRFYIENVVRFLSNPDKIREVLDRANLPEDKKERILSEGLTRYFLTINEPTNLLVDGYIIGVWPPFKKGRFPLMKKNLERLVEAHDIAYEQLKTLSGLRGETQIGIAHNWNYFDGLLGWAIQSFINEGVTEAFERDGNRTDFLGFQYYNRVKFPSLYRPIGPRVRKDCIYSDHPGHGDAYPEGLFLFLKRVNELYPRKGILITEVGFSDTEDRKRPYWMMEIFRNILEAKRIGVPVRGVFLWSLVNNFEWESGMTQKYGLFDEEDLAKPLAPSEDNKVRSWEVWRAVTKAITDPSPLALSELQDWYKKAKYQFEANI